MRKLLLLSFALAAVGAGGPAWAADMPLKAPAAKEYLFLNFGAFGYDTPQSGPVPFFTPAFTWTTAGRTRMQVARVGLNYKFD
jgi:hypothetical protein